MATQEHPPMALSQFLDFIESTGTARAAATRLGKDGIERARRLVRVEGVPLREVRCTFCTALVTGDNCRNCGAARGL